MLSKASIPEIYQQQSIFPSYYDVEILEILLWCRIHSLHGQNRMDFFEDSRNERSKLIKASQECFYNNTLIKFISHRKENVGSNYIINLEIADINVRQNYWKKQRKKSVHDRSSVITQLLFTKHFELAMRYFHTSQ